MRWARKYGFLSSFDSFAMGSFSSNYSRLLSYTKLLTSHVNDGQHYKALSLFQQIHSSLSLSLDPFIFPLALKSCSFLQYQQFGSSIHALTLKSCFITNSFVACGLVDFYGKCVSIHFARKLFDEIPVKNVVVWNSMISMYTRCKDMRNALQLFDEMDLPPDVSTFNTIIMGFMETESGLHDAISFYRKMLKMNLDPNLITLLALLRNSVGGTALHLIKEIHCYSIRHDMDPHSQLRSALVEAYGRCGCVTKAHLVFETVKEKDVVAWSSLISAYALHGQATLAIETFEKMLSTNVKPDDITFLGVLKACSHAGLADEARMYFAKMSEYYGVEPNSDHYACLVDVLSRCGRLHEVYDDLSKIRGQVSVKAWGALLGACEKHGEVDLAEIAGKALREIEPNNPANYVILARLYASKGLYEKAASLRKEMEEMGVKASPGSSWIAWKV